MTATAQKIQDGEREAGSKDMWGFVFQGAAYEGLTCNALEWVASNGGGQHRRGGWHDLGQQRERRARRSRRRRPGSNKISPGGVLNYTEEESRGVWQTGNAVFMRNWPYAYALGNGGDSPIKGKFDVAPLPAGGGDNNSAATLGGWNLAVSKYSTNPEAATDLVLYLTAAEVQKNAALQLSHLPTIESLYDDEDVLRRSRSSRAGRRSSSTRCRGRRRRPRSSTTRSPASSGPRCTRCSPARARPPDNLELLEVDLDDLKGGGW